MHDCGTDPLGSGATTAPELDGHCRGIGPSRPPGAARQALAHAPSLQRDALRATSSPAPFAQQSAALAAFRPRPQVVRVDAQIAPSVAGPADAVTGQREQRSAPKSPATKQSPPARRDARLLDPSALEPGQISRAALRRREPRRRCRFSILNGCLGPRPTRARPENDEALPTAAFCSDNQAANSPPRRCRHT